jgi:hypothetical protein
MFFSSLPPLPIAKYGITTLTNHPTMAEDWLSAIADDPNPFPDGLDQSTNLFCAWQCDDSSILAPVANATSDTPSQSVKKLLTLSHC